jgi:sugar/nucleoside kinase (ribokinase family)
MVKVGDRAPTSTYVAIMNEKGDLFTTIADMAATADLSPEYVRSALREMSQRAPVSMVVIDGNLEPAAISAASEVCRECRMPLWFEPTSVVKATRGLDAIRNGAVDYVSPSERELVALSDSLGCPPGATVQERANSLVSRGVKCVVAKLGASGIALATKDEFITYKVLCAPCVPAAQRRSPPAPALAGAAV